MDPENELSLLSISLNSVGPRLHCGNPPFGFPPGGLPGKGLMGIGFAKESCTGTGFETTPGTDRTLLGNAKIVITKQVIFSLVTTDSKKIYILNMLALSVFRVK